MTGLNRDDSEWFSGPTSIGYGDSDYATYVNLGAPPPPANETTMLAQQIITESGVVLAVLPSSELDSFFMRRTFEVANPAAPSQLKLQLRYEGGFVAYLNGLVVARQGMGDVGAPESSIALATGTNTRNRTTIDLSSYISDLVSGTNVLAIQVRRVADQFNFSMAPELTWKSKPGADPTEGSVTPVSAPVTSATPIAPPAFTTISGKLAVSLDNGLAAYDVYIFSMPDGREIVKIPNARQPNFRFDGQRLLINREGSGVENVYEYNMADGTEAQVSDAPQDWHPFYDPGGNRVVYGDAELTYGKPERVYNSGNNKYYYTGVFKPFMFVQCGLLPPHLEQEPRCRDIPTLGVIIPSGQTSEIQGTHPVWTSNDMIVYKGCNSWSGFAACGIYLVPSSSTKGFSDGFIPSQLSKDTSDTPTDTKGNLIAFMSQRDGNWEAYVMDLNGAGVKNMSNSPTSDDGLPTISPDGNWVAFASDRDGRWAIWVAPIVGGPDQKLFDLPVTVPWGTGDLDWTNERISWGPITSG
ncbi:MAG: PD40 domain-containing protein [Chloroflexi bacterium]|nr:PD40 domain-containing protein [Chloroflexota bacterium]